MNGKDNVGENIAYYRRLSAMTQEELAERLRVSAQAVSKWEQKINSPDIMLLPEIADVFNVNIDELFGRKVNTEPVFELVEAAPWEDDRKIRFAVYHGKKLVDFVAEADAQTLAARIEQEWYGSYRLTAQNMYDPDAFLPDDLYVFDATMKWCVVFTHETADWGSEIENPMKAAQTRYCIICKV